MTRSAFPSPANIRRQTPDELYAKDAQHLFNNLTKEFEKAAKLGARNQNIMIRRRGTGGNAEAVWIFYHMKHADQRQYSIDYCNQKLAATGWRVTGFDFKSVPQYPGGWGWGRNHAAGQMNAIIVKMEYTCDDACAAK